MRNEDILIPIPLLEISNVVRDEDYRYLIVILTLHTTFSMIKIDFLMIKLIVLS